MPRPRRFAEMEPLDRAPFAKVDPAEARATIAWLALRDLERERPPDDGVSHHRIGSITLKPHQVSAVGRLRAAFEEFGGALLCDPVGTGKTYMALAATSACDSILVVAPAVLREMWKRAAELAGKEIAFTSFEALSRGADSNGSFAFLIVDEAHHARNKATRRYKMLSRLASQSKVLLLSATPIHNRSGDLHALLSLFLGERAQVLTSAELGRCVVRREDALDGVAGMPKSASLTWCDLPADDEMPRMLLDLPPPLPPRDGGDSGALVIHSLIRQWASSEAALAAGLERRNQRATALIAALEDGTWPSRSELAAWMGAENSVQFTFSCLLSPVSHEAARLLPVIVAHRDAVSNVLKRLRETESADAARISIVRGIRAAHAGRRIVAFSQYADTVDALFRTMAHDGEVAALSGSGARVTGGRISRGETIARFAPLASGRSAPRRADAVSLLLTTDLMSEGVNLQDAGVVVHLDLPWTPARMEQRLGRIRRIGSQHSTVYAYAIRPPASAEAIVRIESVLNVKMRAAHRLTAEFPSLGALGPRLPGDTRNEPRLIEGCRKFLARWRSESVARDDAGPVTSSVVSTASGFLGVCEWNGRRHLIACLDGRITDDPEAVLECARHCEGEDSRANASGVARSLKVLASWIHAISAIEGAHRFLPGKPSVRKQALRRISTASRRARPHERSHIATLAHRARTAVLATFGAFGESELQRLCTVTVGDEEWLERVIDLASSNASRAGAPPDKEPRILALIVFRKAIALSGARES